MSIMVCDWCGATAYDNDVTWEGFYDPFTDDVLTACDNCVENGVLA